MDATVVSRDVLARESSRWNVLRNLMGAIPLLLLAVAYFLARGRELEILGLDNIWLRRMMQIEFLVIHSFPFLGMFALMRPTWPEARAIKWIVVGLLLWLYLAFAWQAEEWRGVVYFLSLTGATYLGFFLNWTPASAVVRLVGRWLANFVFFMIAAIIMDMPESVNSWVGRHEALGMGCWYFALCGLLELSGFYQLPFWDKIAAETQSRTADVKVEPIDEGLSALRIVYRGLRPIVGTVALAVGPLTLASALTVLLAGVFEDLRTIGFWVVMLPVLLAIRWRQTIWVVRTIAGTARPWWRRVRPMIFLALTSLAYVISGFHGDARLPRKVWVSGEAIQRFLLAEILALLVLIPLTWWAIVKTQRDRVAAQAKTAVR